jgi:hypothetical protein
VSPSYRLTLGSQPRTPRLWDTEVADVRIGLGARPKLDALARTHHLVRGPPTQVASQEGGTPRTTPRASLNRRSHIGRIVPEACRPPVDRDHRWMRSDHRRHSHHRTRRHRRVHHRLQVRRLVGVDPLEASSGRRLHHGLNRGGARRANQTLHTVVITHPPQAAKPPPTSPAAKPKDSTAEKPSAPANAISSAEPEDVRPTEHRSPLPPVAPRRQASSHCIGFVTTAPASLLRWVSHRGSRRPFSATAQAC